MKMGKTLKNNVFYIIILLPLLIQQCTKNKVDSAVISEYEECDSIECKIDFGSSFDFNWNIMYVINESVTSKGISEIIGFKYDGVKDINRSILFVNNQQIVYEQKDVSIENPYKVNFIIDSIYFFERDNAVFRIEKINNYYNLYHEPMR